MIRAVVTLLILSAFATPSHAQDDDRIIFDLTTSAIDVGQDFIGVNITVFGTVSPAPEASDRDVVIVVRGPTEAGIVRKGERVKGVWMSGAPVHVRDAPGFYYIAGTGPVSDLLNDTERATRQLGPSALGILLDPDNRLKKSMTTETLDAYREAFVAEKKSRRLYIDDHNGVSMTEGALFKAVVPFPAEIPVGDYDVEAYLVEDGAVAASHRVTLDVHRAGFFRSLYALAHGQPLVYGLLCVAVSLLSGWTASLAFRK